MMRLMLAASLALLSFGASAPAQESGGLGLDPGIKDGPHGLARPMEFTRPPFVTAHDIQGGLSAADHQGQDQAMITRLRGDPGFLSGFSFGTPLAASRQAQMVPSDAGYSYRRRHRHQQPQIIINESGPLAVTLGNGNVVQQQLATGAGPIAQQQVATTPAAGSHGAGAANVVSGSGNIIQHAGN